MELAELLEERQGHVTLTCWEEDVTGCWCELQTLDAQERWTRLHGWPWWWR